MLHSLALVACLATLASAALHAPPDSFPVLPPPALDAASLATTLTLTPDQQAAAVAAVSSAKSAINATVAAKVAALNATKTMFMDSVVLPTGTIRAGGLRGGGLLPKKNWTADGATFLSSELALAKNVKDGLTAAAVAKAGAVGADAKAAVGSFSRKAGSGV